MLVYGDRSDFADPRERLEEIQNDLAAVALAAPGIERHAKVVGALIQAGRLLQGVADQDAETGALDHLVYALAACVVRSWDSRFARIGELPQVPAAQMPRWAELRMPEGFAYYAVYPEAYIAAARRLVLSAPPRVIGIRSIGTTLGAVVAATLIAPPPVTVRPFGDPFARRVELPPALIDEDAHYVIVDEGPGLSGSSFGAVADGLEARDVPLERIAFVPSHGGDLGPQASDAHRRRWRKAQRAAAEFDPSWLEEMFGPLERLSVGERLKFLAGRSGERLLLKFAGLGSVGDRKLELARALHSAGFTSEPLGLVHGFMVERWCEDAQPLGRGDKPVEEIGRYVGTRARLFPAGEGDGASIGELLAMCRRNISVALSDEAARGLAQFDPARLQPRVRRVRIDGKLDRGKWLRLADGRLLKTDALDHHCGHDLIGCQDMAWDIAGAIAELDLVADETGRLIAAAGRTVDRELLDFYRVAYVAFRVGHAALAGDGSADRYAAQLGELLHHCAATPQESSVD